MVIETASRLAPAYTARSHSAGATSSAGNTEAIASNTPSRRTSAWNRAAATCNRTTAKNAKARVADQCENMLDPNLLEHANQDIRDRLGHRCLLKNRGLLSRTKSISDASNGNPSTVGSNQGLHCKGVRSTADYPQYDLFSVFSREGPSRRGLSARPTMMLCCIEIGSLAGNVSSSASSSNRSCSDRALPVCLAFMEHA